MSDTTEMTSDRRLSLDEKIIRGTAVVVLLLAFLFGAWLVRFILRQEIPFDTDEADHALASLDVYTSLMHASPSLFAKSIANQAFYPPLHSLFGASAFILLGPSFPAARLPSVIFFILTAVIVGVTAKEVCRNSLSVTANRALPLAAGIFALLLGVTSLEAIENAVLCMLEPLGTALCALLLLVAARYETAKTARSIPWLVFLSLLVVLTKYSFGVVLLPAVASALFFKEQRNGFAFAVRRSVIYSVSITFAVIVWLVCTDAYSAWRFITSHPSSGPILGTENLLYDLRAWHRGYFVAPSVALAVIPLMALTIFEGWRWFVVKLGAAILFFSEVVAVLSTTNETRHFLFALPAAWLLAGMGFAFALMRVDRILTRFGFRPGRALFLVPATVALLLYFFSERLPPLPGELRRALEGEPALKELGVFLTKEVDPRLPIIGNGFSDQFGPQTVRFILANAAQLHSSQLEIDAFPFREENFQRARDRKRHIDRPFRDPHFPREKFADVLAAGHYRYAIQLQSRSNSRYRGADAAEFRSGLEAYPKTALEAGGWRMVVWNLNPSALRVGEDQKPE